MNRLHHQQNLASRRAERRVAADPIVTQVRASANATGSLAEKMVAAAEQRASRITANVIAASVRS